MVISIGQRFGRLTVTRANVKHKGRTACECVCDCGKPTITLKQSLGRTQSCGCLTVEKTIERSKTHGEGSGARTPEYDTWRAIKNRCYYQRGARYKQYGGRGIHVCDRWLASYENFLADVGRRPSPKHSLDRIDVNGHYEPSNVRWATKKEQSNNRQDNRILTFGGHSHTVAEWANITGISPYTLRSRLNEGWDTERILTTPLNVKPAVEPRYWGPDEAEQ